jgi:hypothetical protein
MNEPIEIDADPLSGFDTLLRAAWDNETQVPNAILDLIPSVTIPVSSLLAANLPALLYSSAINLRPTRSCVTNHAARWTAKELFEAPVPPRRWLGDLEATLKNEWHTHARVTSVQHPTVSNLRLPLWVGNFWWSLVDTVEQKEEWRKAECWISGQVQDAKVYEARELMRRTPWGTKIWVLAGADCSSFVGVISRLLSTDWLGGRNIDTLAAYLNFCAGNDRGGAGECWVGDTYFSTCLRRVFRATKTAIRTNWDLNTYRDAITARGCRHLFFPANLGNTHWIAFGVDLKKKEYCFGESSISLCADACLLTTTLCELGDSLGDRKSSTDLEHICRGLEGWLNVTFGAGFKDLGKTLPIGRQADSYSCGICVINAIEHAMFGVPLFTDSDRHHLRIQYFVGAVKHLLNDVRITFRVRWKPHLRLFFSPPNSHARAL